MCVPLEEFGKRLEKDQADRKVVEVVEQQTKELLAQPKVTLKTGRKFVFNSFIALGVAKRLMKEKGATNFGFAGPVIYVMGKLMP